jgi:acyl transferase domain-containing protein/enoyl-CoA hydratase/carnithine racemase/NAD(P)-dependent dehydrogenase (short-subunit alcohol dehydrogenase family)/acyl carrier protein/SAM-dependent methyltransferase
MKQQLRQIYLDVSEGRLSQKEALEKIMAIKRMETRSALLLATPVWQAVSAEASAGTRFDNTVDNAHHHVILCELPSLAQSHWLSLQAALGQNIAQRYSEHALACFERIRTILQARPRRKVLVQIVVPDHGEQMLLVGLSALLETAALENPQIVGQLIVVSADIGAEELGRRLGEEKHRAVDALVRYAQGGRQVRRWQEVQADPEKPPIAFKNDGVYLITGGLGGLGALFAKEILGQTSGARVVLTGRGALSSDKRAFLDGRVSYRQLDVGDLDQVEQLMAALAEEYGRLDGILHCAGMLADNFILKKNGAEFREVLAPKVTGTFNLDQASRGLELDFLVLFSSIAGAMGNVGQADYAAANGFMDQFAAYRNRLVAAGQRRGRTRSINWPLWQAGGMGADPATRELLQQATGMQPMETARGVDTFHRSLAWPYDQVLVAEGDLIRIRRALHDGLTAEPESSMAAGVAIDGDSLVEKTEDYLRQQCAALLKLPFQALDPQAPLEKYGIDSILAMKLTTHLEKTFGSLSKTLFFEYQTIGELAGYLARSHAARLATLFARTGIEGAKPAQPEPPPPAESKRASSRRLTRPARDARRETAQEPIAIIGLSGRYPEAVDLEAYWRNLRDGRDCIIEVPKERWDWREYYSEDRTRSGHHYSRWGGFMAGVDEFDPLFFGISPREAKLIDPQERLFLQHAWMAVEDAGYTRASLQVPRDRDLPGQVGVYAGVMYTEYQLFGVESGARGHRLGINNSAASIANRVSYTLNLHGPSVTLDTMCSSSLTAIHFACLDLKLGRTDLAIAGGVNVSIHPSKYLMLSAGQFISSDGHCQSFGEGGDGYIPGEGVGVVLLKRLSDAERDGDHIYGVIRGSSLNHGGKTNGYTVPNPQAQAAAISRALAESQVDARQVSYVEAHGTGTKLGDPIEIAALSKAFQRDTQDTGFCLIGSAKSNIGHCESAAAIAGLTKVLLQMQHQQIVPSLHSATLNPHIDFDATPFVVNQTLTPWEPPVIDGRMVPRIAGISSFGAGGSNAHVIVEEHQPQVRRPMVLPEIVIVLSAKTAEQLRQKAHELLEFVQPRRGTLDLVATGYTLQVGREAMDHRLGFLVRSEEQLAETLRAYVAGVQGIEDVHQGQVKRNESLSVFSTDADLQQTVDKWIANNKFSRLLDLWIKGVEVDWSKVYGDVRPRRVSLPTYPFARDRYWIEIPAAVPLAKGDSAVLHPLLHGNTSILGEQRYGSTFTGDEPFLTAQKILPAAAYLEMARAAIEHAVPERAESTILELHDIAFGQPLVIAEKTRIDVALMPGDGDQIDFEIDSGDLVLCQGRAVFSREPAPARLDLAQHEGRMLPLPSIAAETSADYVLHPTLIEAALRAAMESNVPFSIERLRIVWPCGPDMRAVVRDAPAGQAADIDLCDERGNIAVQMRGVTWQAVSQKAAEPAVHAPAMPSAAPARKEIVFVPSAPTAAPTERKKQAISLAAPARRTKQASERKKSTVSLSAPTSASVRQRSVRMDDDGNGIFSIHIAAAASAADLRQALDRIRQEASLKVLRLSGLARGLERGRESHNEAVGQGLYEAIVSFPYPVIAVLPEDAIGGAFMAAALCDLMVCSEDAIYGYTDARGGLYPTLAEAVLFGERFGEARAQDLLYVSPASTGRQLREKGWTCPIVAAPQIEASAQKLASALAAKPQDALRLLKQHLTRRLAPLAGALRPVELTEDVTETSAERVAVIDVAHLAPTLAEMQSNAVVLVIEDSDIGDGIVRELQRLIVESPIPVVAALAGNAKGNAWLVSQFCHATLHSRTGAYSSAGIGPALVQTAAAVFAHRFGSDAAREILLTGADYSGVELRQRAVALTEEHDRVVSAAIQLAASLATLPRTTLAEWQQHTATILRETTRGLPAEWDREEPTADLLPAAPAPVPLQSRVITATAHPEGIVVVKMEDRDAKNMFSDVFMEGMKEVFAHIEKTPAYKVVILTGYDSYFASGNTKEGLLAVQEGRARFTDSKVFQLPLDCRLPVIAAIQGHAIGAGWTLGLYADLVLLSGESRYVSPYMGYGFTPGAGATWVLADKLGEDLARESMLTAEPFTGDELHARGLGLSVLPRLHVVPAAMTQARQMARMSRYRSIAFKQELTRDHRERLEETYRLELAMLDETFVGRADPLAQIESTFRHAMDTSPAAPPQMQATASGLPPGSEVLPDVTATLRTLLASELQMRESEVDENAQFVDLGLDSVSGISWIRKINEKYQTSIEPTKVYTASTLVQLSRHVADEAARHGAVSQPASPSAAETPAPRQSIVSTPFPTAAPRALTTRRGRKTQRTGGHAPSRATEPIAIIGMAGQFPQARTLEEYWRNIAEGRNCVIEVPRARWNVDDDYQPGGVVPGKTNSRWIGALEDYDLFDPLFFNISPNEAETMDPQQRLFLQACWHSIEDAGYDARTLWGSKCGVFVGCATSDYHQLARERAWTAQGFTGNSMSILAARISYFLNLRGPSIAVDTACSSSLVALAHACDSLNSGGSDLALAGGVCVLSGREMHIKSAQAGMLSPDGRCFTFDRRASGIVVGEGVGAVLLKRLDDAVRDHDIIRGVIRGWGVNQDGRTNGITAPNPESQTRLEQDVYDRYGIDPADIQLIEAHGTATKLGDPIEVQGLKKAFAKYTQKKDYCALGSVKSNIGHTLTAAGIAGVIKLVLALEQKQLPPTINFEQLSEHIDLTGSPFYVNTRSQEWKADGGKQRQAAISAFGFSGTNAHIVISEPLPRTEAAAPHGKTIVPLSARTAEQLEQKAADLLSFLRRGGPSPTLADVAYTLQVGRAPMDERLGFIVSSVEQLADKLQAWIGGEPAIEDVSQGQVKRSHESLGILNQDQEAKETLLGIWIARKKLSTLLDVWVKGLELDWNRLYDGARPRRIHLPLYPFAKERYWVEAATPAPVVSAVAPSTARYPRARHRARASAARITGIGREVVQKSAETSRPLFFQECWQERPLTPAAGPSDGASFIIFTDRESGIATGELAGARLVYRAAAYRKLSEGEYHCRFNEGSDIQALLDDVTSAVQPITIVYEWASGEQRAGVHALFGLFRAIRTSAQVVGRVILAGQYDPARAETCWDYSWAGFERSLRRLLPATRVTVLYTDRGRCTTGQLLEAAQDGGVLWHHDDRRLALSFEPVELTGTSAGPALQDGGTYLITGGGGALGLKFAHYLARHHRANLLLLGRSPVSPRIEQELARLKEAGARDVRYDAVDVSDRSALASWAQTLPHAISGIIHAAGVEPSGAFHERTAADIDSVLDPKTVGTLALDEVLGEHPLDFTCYFSSLAASFGDDGACDYAIANRFQTAYAIHRRQKTATEGKTIVINWPLWAEGGMGFQDPGQTARYLKMSGQELGNEPLATQAGLDLWRDILKSDRTQIMLVIGKPSRVDTFLQKLYHGRPPLPAVRETPDGPKEGNRYRYSSKIEEVYSLVLPDVHSRMEYLTFCPFESRRPGFSMSATYLNPKAHAGDRQHVLAKQTEMRQVLFCNEDFANLQSVLDFGCGHGTDVIQIGSLFPHLRVDGFTITAEQARLGNQRIASRNLGSRVAIHHKDSAKDPFPGQYDLVFGIEVAPHVEDKESLFRKIRESLREDGTVLLMDLICNQPSSIVDRFAGVTLLTPDQWLRVISASRFRVDQFIDVSPQIANFLYDPHVEDHVRNVPQGVRDTYRSYAELAEAFEKGFVSYALVRLKAADDWDERQLAAHNREALRNPTPYPAALEAMLRRPRVDYPPPAEIDWDEPNRRPVERPRPLQDVPVPGPRDQGRLQEELRTSLAGVLHMKASGVDLDQPFSELGLDSFLGVEWINTINAGYGTVLPNILVYDYPSIRSLASFLGGELAKLPAACAPAIASFEPAMPPPVVRERISGVKRRAIRTRKRSDAIPAEKVAIIGMSGRYPQAGTLQQYWQNLAASKNSIVEIPRHRWDIGRFYDPDRSKADKTCSKWLGALDDVDCFDPLFFRISPQEALHMDPQHRLFLQEAYRAFEDAGYSGESLSAKKCGVYLGISMSEYASRLRQNGVRTASMTGNNSAIAASRIAYYLNLKGPAISVDTACSSSLVALHLASQALLSGETDMALAGGVTLWLAPEAFLSMSQAGMLSATGQCRAFDDGADGIVVAEGVGALVLKRLSDAQRDHDFIHGVILGSGINQDGRTNGITAPSVNSQIELLRGIYSRNAIDPDTISYVETHGTGTKLGDPIELTALATVFKEKTARKNYCGLGSVKSNIGHSAAAAGVAGVHKVLLAMRHRTLVPTLHVTRENAQFDFAGSPFYISRETQPWDVPPGSLRRATVSAFGFSGTNAHVVIEEPPAREQAAAYRGDPSVIVPLSARTEEQLRQRARDLLECISAKPVDLADLAYTLQIGRDAMEERLGFVVSSLDQLLAKLTAYVEGEEPGDDSYRSRVESSDGEVSVVGRDDDMQEAIERWIARRKLSKLAELWTKGLKFDWNKLWGDRKPRRVSLPAYPFARDHYWIDDAPVSPDLDREFAMIGNGQSIEEIIDRLGDDLLESGEAVRLLKVLV